MGLGKGQTNNKDGRPKGTKNVKTAQWEALAESITTTQAEKFSEYMNELWSSADPKNRNQAAELYLKTLEYFKPKYSRVESKFTDDSELVVRIIKE